MTLALNTGKVDSSGLPSKIKLRMWLLKRMGFDEVYVLDTCAGLGHVWEAMEDHVTIRQWTKCDIKPRRLGTIKLDATDAIERFPIETYNVVDIDPYGEPWEPYMALLPRIKQPTAVFLTYCHRTMTGLSYAMANACGIPTTWVPDLPRHGGLVDYMSEVVLGRTVDFVNVLHSAKMQMHRSGTSATIMYYALGLEPK